MGLPDQKLLCMLALETRCIAIKLKNIPALLQSIEQYEGSVTKLKTSKDVAPDRRTVNSSDSNTTTISAGSLHYIANGRRWENDLLWRSCPFMVLAVLVAASDSLVTVAVLRSMSPT